MQAADGAPHLTPEHWSVARPFTLAGVQLIDTDVAGAVSSIEAAVRAGAAQGVHLCNAYTLTLAATDADYLRSLSHPGVVNLPDGTPVSWYYRLARGGSARGPVRGPTLMKSLLAKDGLRHFLLGGTPDVLRDLEAGVVRANPATEVVGRYAPPFHDLDEADIAGFAEQIRSSRAQVVWVGLGTPKQDQVIAELVGQVDVVLIGVGAAFDFLSGHKREAPAILHRSGLEWVYRLASEPRRLWRRYLIGNVRFVALAIHELRLGRRPRR